MSFRFDRADIPADDLTWLGSKHAVGDARTITLDGAAFEGLSESGFIPSGIAVTEAGDGRFYPAVSPSDVDGFLLTYQRYSADNIVAPLLDHGRVIAAKAPEQLIAVAEITSPHFVIVGATPATNPEQEG